jgi:hypothetical protein
MSKHKKGNAGSGRRQKKHEWIAAENTLTDMADY